ncbi:MAG: XRE family transcriptional regulator, partial [Lachnospira sp.]|nr:XRE family transcriptional regulator [Lachnospira sp.]
GGLEEGAYNVLLQKGDYAPEKKDNKVMQSVSSVYWMIVTAIYLAWSFITKDWEFTWIVWPVAGVLFGAIAAIISVTKKD